MSSKSIFFCIVWLFSGFLIAKEDAATRKVQFVNKSELRVNLFVKGSDDGVRSLDMSAWKDSMQGQVMELPRRAYKRYLGKVKYIVDATITSDEISQEIDSKTLDMMNINIESAPTEIGSGVPTFEIAGTTGKFRINYVGVKALERKIIGVVTPLNE